jgi:hypothetical protein
MTVASLVYRSVRLWGIESVVCSEHLSELLSEPCWLLMGALWVSRSVLVWGIVLAWAM